MTGQDTVRIFATVRGRVQGVGYRWFARRQAQALGLSGWVRNEVDGTVTVEVEGPADLVDQYVEGLRKGPSGSRVDEVLARRAPPAGYSRFRIR